MLYLSDNQNYEFKTTNNQQTIRPFPDPSFPFIIHRLTIGTDPTPYVPWHWHDDLEFVWVHSGSLIVTIPEQTIVLQTGDGIFLNHTLLHTMHAAPGQICDIYSMRFYSKLLFPDKNASLAVQYLHPLLMTASLKHIHLTPNGGLKEHMLQTMEEIAEIYYARKNGFELNILSQLYALWADVNTYAQQHVDSPSLTNAVITDFNRVIEAIHYIANHYAEPITLEDIANSIHLSKSECCRCFKRTIALSPVEFLIQYRIMESIRKIQTREKVANSISALSVSVGFNSASYFNKQFKRYLKCTPLEYRKKLLSGTEETSFEQEFHDILINSTEQE